MGRNSGPAATLATLQDDRNAGHRMNAAPGSDAAELWATCPRVIGQETPSSESHDPWPDIGGADGNRRFRLLNGPIDCAAGHFHGPVTGTRAEHHGANAPVWKTSPGIRTFN